MISEKKRCPKCFQTIENEDSLICLYCGCSLSNYREIDNPNPNYFKNKDESTTNTFLSLGVLWWGLLIVGGIISTIVSISLLLSI